MQGRSWLRIELNYDPRTQELLRKYESPHGPGDDPPQKVDAEALREIASRLDTAANRDDALRSIGAALGEVLFGGVSGIAARDMLRGTANASRPHLICLHVQDERLRCLPWEAAVLDAPEVGGDEDAPVPLCLRDDIMVIREGTGRSLQTVGHVRILPVIAESRAADQLGDTCGCSPTSAHFELLPPLVAQPWRVVRDALERGRPHVLVYLGHVGADTADQQARISFCERDEAVSTASFAELVQSSEELQLLVLLGCNTWSEVVCDALWQHIPALAALSSTAVDWDRCVPWLQAFVSQLVEGNGDIIEAHTAMRSAARGDQPEAPVLLLSGQRPCLLGTDASTTARLSYCEALRYELEDMDAGQPRQTLYIARRLASRSTADSCTGRRHARAEQELVRDELTEAMLFAALQRRRGLVLKAVIGGAGSGKTELVRNVAWRLAGEYAHKPSSACVPIVVDLHKHASWITKHLEDHEAPPEQLISRLLWQAVRRLGLYDYAEVSDLLRVGGAVVLMDGWDELRPREVRQELAQRLKRALAPRGVLNQCAVLLSGRPGALRALKLGALRAPDVLEFDRLSDANIENYVRHYFEDDPRQARRVHLFLKSRPPKMRQMVRLPLFLQLLCHVCENTDASLPADEGELMQAVVENLFQRRGAVRQEERDALQMTLGAIAWECAKRGEGVGDMRGREVTALLHELRGKVEWRALDRELDQLQLNSEQYRRGGALGWLLSCGVLVQPDGGATERVSFVTQQLQEYLAGWWLAAQPEPVVADAFQEHVWDPNLARILEWAIVELAHNRAFIVGRIINWLLDEHDDKHDDRFDTLVVLASRMLGKTEEAVSKVDPALVHRTCTTYSLAYELDQSLVPTSLFDPGDHGILAREAADKLLADITETQWEDFSWRMALIGTMLPSSADIPDRLKALAVPSLWPIWSQYLDVLTQLADAGEDIAFATEDILNNLEDRLQDPDHRRGAPPSAVDSRDAGNWLTQQGLLTACALLARTGSATERTRSVISRLAQVLPSDLALHPIRALHDLHVPVEQLEPLVCWMLKAEPSTLFAARIIDTALLCDAGGDKLKAYVEAVARTPSAAVVWREVADVLRQRQYHQSRVSELWLDHLNEGDGAIQRQALRALSLLSYPTSKLVKHVRGFLGSSDSQGLWADAIRCLAEAPTVRDEEILDGLGAKLAQLEPDHLMEVAHALRELGRDGRVVRDAVQALVHNPQAAGVWPEVARFLVSEGGTDHGLIDLLAAQVDAEPAPGHADGAAQAGIRTRWAVDALMELASAGSVRAFELIAPYLRCHQESALPGLCQQTGCTIDAKGTMRVRAEMSLQRAYQPTGSDAAKNCHAPRTSMSASSLALSEVSMGILKTLEAVAPQKLARADIVNRNPWSESQIKINIRTLVDEGLVERHGKKAGYTITEEGKYVVRRFPRSGGSPSHDASDSGR